MSDKEPKDHWNECGQIFFLDGEGYVLTPELKVILLGSEEDMLMALGARDMRDDLTLLQRRVLIGILEYRKERGIAITDIITTGMERAGNNRATRSKQKATRLLTLRKRLPLRPPRSKGKSLPFK